MYFNADKVDNNLTLEKQYEIFSENNNSNIRRNFSYVDIGEKQGLLIQSEQNDAPINHRYIIVFIFIHYNIKYNIYISSDDLESVNSTYNTIKNSLILK